MTVITTVEIRDHGTLTIGFHNSGELSVSPHPLFESWYLSGHGVPAILVGPGGDTDWQP